jgi:hypothetical protein
MLKRRKGCYPLGYDDGEQCNGIPDNDNSCNGSYGNHVELISFYVQMGTTTPRSREYGRRIHLHMYSNTIINGINYHLE